MARLSRKLTPGGLWNDLVSRKAAPPLRRVAHKYRDKSISSTLIIDGTVVEHKGMPRFEISVAEADGLIAYIRSLDRQRR